MPSNPTVDRSGIGNVWWNPNTGVNTRFYPIGGLTATGIWVPYQVNPDGSFPIEIQPTPLPPAHFDDFQGTTTPGVQQTLIDVTVPSNTNRALSQVLVVTRVTGEFYVMAGASVIGSGRTGPSCDGRMTFSPARTLLAGTEYKVLFTARAGSPAQDVECYVQATDVLP